MTSTNEVVGGSFRDPSGFVFRSNGRLLRHVAEAYAPHYDQLMESGLYDVLVKRKLLVAHEEAPTDSSPVADAYRVLAPTEVPLISYPYEWSFSALKAAALATLDLQEIALDHGMTLKDATAYNIQFVDLKPVMIDTLSFEIRPDGAPWVAYKQFCEHFLVPLALMSKVDVRLGELFQQFVEGIPLEIGARLLPWSTKLSPGLQMHVHLHAKAQRTHQDSGAGPKKAPNISENAQRGMLQSLRGLVEGMTWTPSGTEWGDYYTFTNYSDAAASKKAEMVKQLLKQGLPESGGRLLDLGGNNGLYSRLGLDLGAQVISSDVDPAAVEKNYRMALGDKLEGYDVIRLDLMRPSPGLGWALDERDSAFDRCQSDVVMTLALIHHICISNNVPLAHFGKLLASLAPTALVEFVPKSDSQVKILLASRPDIFPAYTEEGFEDAMAPIFEIAEKAPIEGTDRTLYLLRRRSA
ncbi:MAG: class I SAM-dependent methyltransferase [Proteobacteria bacterium]|nr:class I SAM-dependent methyltransferase [Pseudomonadota bacterium]